jgi:NAD/NADP transhydrogenase beta subunit
MNRSLANVILGGYTQTGKAALVEGTAVETTVESTVEALTQARSVIIVPGCGPARAMSGACQPIARSFDVITCGMTVKNGANGTPTWHAPNG